MTVSRCIDCDKYNSLADENEKLLAEYNQLKIKYDRYDALCWDFGMVGFAIGVILTLIGFHIIGVIL